MKYPTTPEILESNPDLLQEAFNRIELAVQQVLPGRGDLHPRYAGVNGVGLAIVAGPIDVDPNFYNPLIGDIGMRIMSADNLLDQPLAWARQEIDPKILGGEIPIGKGRFTVYAAAKANHVNTRRVKDSFSTDLTLEPGMVGFSGAIRLGEGVISTSGLWEAHDKVVSWTAVREMGIGKAYELPPRSTDEIATDLEDVVKKISNRVGDRNPAEIPREELKEMIDRTGNLMKKRMKEAIIAENLEL